MAKKAARNGKQQAQFEGDGFPKKPPREVTDALDDFLDAKRSAAKASKKKAEKEEALVEAMHKHDVGKLDLDGENKIIVLEKSEKPKIKTIPKEERDAREQREATSA